MKGKSIGFRHEEILMILKVLKYLPESKRKDRIKQKLITAKNTRLDKYERQT